MKWITELSNTAIFVALLSCITLLFSWQNNNGLEPLLLLLILVIFLFDKKKMSTTEHHLHDILDNISDAIITINGQGLISSVNHPVEDIFGYQASELIGENIKRLMPSPYHELHDGYLANYLKTGEGNVIGATREIKALRKNGEVFDAVLWVHQLPVNGELEFMGVVRDISESRHLDKLKTEFISTVSHELRTPLTSIRGSLGMLKSGVLGDVPEKASRMVELAHNNTERLINLVNDILDIEKIQAGKMELKCAPLNITELVKNSIESNEAYAAGCSVSLQLSDNPKDFDIYADELRLQQVMANLLSNAAKFSPENGLVTITIEKRGALIRVSVKDQGLGIPEVYRSKIFQKFSQLDSSDSRQKGGTGLGLNITKAIVEHHGGHIDYITREGEGSTFFFELLEYQEPAVESVSIPPLTMHWSSVDKRIKSHGHILVLEDEQDIANLLSLLLEQQGFQVTVCHDSQAAKEHLKSTQFDAITVDIRLPGQDGLSFIQEVRDTETDCCVPIIIISAEAELKKTPSTSALRIIDWIDKPIDTEHLHKALKKALKASKRRSIILHVEDNQDLIEMMASLLADTVEIINAPTLQAAKSIIANTSFDLMILDIGLPDGSGLDLLPLMNKQKPLIPVFIFSAQSVEQSVLNQVDEALVKSKVTNEQLVETIKQLISPLGADDDRAE